ncbi:MAG: hypothetical protein AAF432_08800 [Planctomycetota bacterium]
MKNRLALLVLGAVAMSIGTTSVSAQALTDRKPKGQEVIYRLNDGASYIEGCFDPCLCPISFSGIRGTLTLKQTGMFGNVFTYAVDDVNWFVGNGATQDRLITGSGTYTRISGFAGWVHEIELKLSIDGGPFVEFNSGLQFGGGDFPDISGLSVNMNDLFCYDIQIGIDASNVPADEVLVEQLVVNESSLTQGCLPPCLCPIAFLGNLTGEATFVPLIDSGNYQEFAVVNVAWKTVPFAVPADFPHVPRTFIGNGRYVRIVGIAGFLQEMELSLSDTGAPAEVFASGLVDGGADYPVFGISISDNDFVCFNRVLGLSFKPRPAPLIQAGTP